MDHNLWIISGRAECWRIAYVVVVITPFLGMEVQDER